MKHSAIFQALPPAVLLEAAPYLDFNPQTSASPMTWLRSLTSADQEAWLDLNRSSIEEHFCSVGSWSFGTPKTYEEVVGELAQKIGVSCANARDVTTVETAIVTKVWNDALAKMMPEQLAKIRTRLEELASNYGKSLGMEFSGFAALSAAQLSGFGVYLLGSTLLGSINGMLGLGLSFGAFTGLSSLISTVIGPVGWAALGLATIVKLGSPNYKKILPVVLLIATSRGLISAEDDFIAVTKVFILENHGQEAANSAEVIKTNEAVTVAYGTTIATFELPREAKDKPAANHLSGAPVEYIPSSSLIIRSTESRVTNQKPVKDPELLAEVQRDIDVNSSRIAVRPPASALRRPSKRERDIFRLKHPEMHKLAESLGVDYHNLGPDDQKTLQELVTEQIEVLRKDAVAARQEVQKQRGATAEKRSFPGESESSKKKKLARKKTEYTQLLENIEFKDAALLKLCESTPEESISYLGELRRLNQGHFNPKCTIAQINPKILEQEAGREGRIYYRANGSMIVIELIGTKATQAADIRNLRAGNQ